MIALHKSNKPDYTLAKAYQPISLVETLVKTLSACVAETLVHTQKSMHSSLPHTLEDDKATPPLTPCT
jgi:hypothetical protein